ncbi:hypothetical protein WICPIJ_003560 [Wickerhamomyces pijperi]|uniref:Uncharacterized protein n=1 Tax=Wickerhamomyces pijperi TaxID=599730 RepID=A0A9P8TNR2_WICPI|nr:hypothetical protein WICPIJ_003560 [Wickerhamomyces pijperi]
MIFKALLLICSVPDMEFLVCNTLINFCKVTNWLFRSRRMLEASVEYVSNSGESVNGDWPSKSTSKVLKDIVGSRYW